MRMLYTTLLALALLGSSTPASAGMLTFDVDLSGNDPVSGHLLRLFGTITLDPDLAVGTAIQSSALSLEHQGATSFGLPSIPTYIGDVAANLDWVVSGSTLYLNRTGNTSTLIQWTTISGPVFARAEFGSGANTHRLLYAREADLDFVVLKPASGPDGPTGFAFGTQEMVVPEPTTSVLWGGLAGLFLMGTALRRRRKLVPAAG